MTSHQMKVFLTVFEMRSITGAAKTLYISQPGVSSIIKSLEEDLGTRLFIYKGKSIRPTDACIAVYDSIKQMYQIEDHMRNAISTNKFKSTLKIGSGIAFGETCLPDILADFKEQNPTCIVTCMIDVISVIEDYLLRSDVDICIGESLLQHHPSLHYQELYHSPLVAVCSSTHPLAKEKEVSADVLKTFDLLFRTKGSQTRAATDIFFAGSNCQVSPVMESDSSIALIQAAKKNLGIAIITLDLYVLSRLNGIVALLLKGQNYVRYMDIITKNIDSNIENPMVKSFIKCANDHIESHGLNNIEKNIFQLLTVNS